jgi:hypothetical protein
MLRREWYSRQVVETGKKDIYVRHISWEASTWKIETRMGGLSYIKTKAAYGDGV